MQFSSQTSATRILHVITSLSPVDGGPPEMIRQLARNYAAIGVHFVVASLDDPDAPFLKDLDFPVVALGPAANAFRYSPRLATWLRQNAPGFDLIVLNNTWQYTSVAVWRAAMAADVPFVNFTHGALDVFFKRQYPLKHCKKMMYWPLQYRILCDAKAVLFTSETERSGALAAFPGKKYNALVLPYGTNAPAGSAEQQKRAFHTQLPHIRGKRFLLFLGRIHPKKGCDLLIEAFAKVAGETDLHLVIAGPDQVGWKAALDQLAHTLGVADRIHWPGLLAGHAKYGAFRAAEAFILPSHQENFGIAVAEALACGTPVLISDQVNIWREIVTDGAGLVEPDTFEGTTRLLNRWLALSPVQRAAMAEQAILTFDQRFSLRRTAEAIQSIALQRIPYSLKLHTASLTA